jgi:uncharacterized membrane protein
MNSATVPGFWPANRSTGGTTGWYFARPFSVQNDESGSARQALQWALRRNCSITPRQLLSVYLSLCAASLLIGVGFWWHGAVYVLGFAGLELLVIGAAMLVYARHAADRDLLTLDGRELQVEQHFGRQVTHASFRAEWVCVEPAQAQGSLVELAGQGRSMRIGRFVRPELRAALAQELRSALRRAQAGLPLHEVQENLDSELEVKR